MDYRTPNIYDPSTLTEPYAYARANPTMFWDPNGLDPTSERFEKSLEDFGGDKTAYVEALLQFLQDRSDPKATYLYADHNHRDPYYTNFNTSTGLFSYISDPTELEYQLAILEYFQNTNPGAGWYSPEEHKHLESELLGIKAKYLKARKGFALWNQHVITWNKGGNGQYRDDPVKWTAGINNYKGQANLYSLYTTVEGMVVAGGSAANRNPRTKIILPQRVEPPPTQKPQVVYTPAPNTGPGQFERVIESMSDRAAVYQSQITGRLPDVGYKVRGVKFDGFDEVAGVLLDAKGPGYATFVRNGRFQRWFGGADGLVDQAQRQLRAAGETRIQWHFAEEAAAEATRNLFTRRGISGIDVIFTPVP